MAVGIEVEGTFYTTAQAAAALGLSHDRVRGAVREGTLKATKVNARLNLISAEAIEEYRRHHLGRPGRPRRKSDDSNASSAARSAS